jgi:hypothetical protein
MKQLVGITHIYMDIPKGDSLYSYLPLSQTNKNVTFFFFSFLFCKIGEQEGVIGLAQGEALAPVGRARW